MYISCSIVSNSVTPQTVATQALLSTEFPRQENWSGQPFSIFPIQESNLGLQHHRWTLLSEPPGKSVHSIQYCAVSGWNVLQTAIMSIWSNVSFKGHCFFTDICLVVPGVLQSPTIILSLPTSPFQSVSICFNKFKRIEIISNLFSDHKDMKLEINYRKKNSKTQTHGD